MTELEEAAVTYVAAYRARVQADLEADGDESTREAEQLALARLCALVDMPGNGWDEA